MNSNHFIFGYGSLINKASRAKTGQTGDAIPVMAKGIKRRWSLVVSSIGLTALGATLDDDSKCNGVLVHVEEAELPKFDERETPYGYSRIQLQRSFLAPFLQGDLLPAGIFWTYVTENPGQASTANPIIESYLGVILTGCWDFGPEFARQFIQTTHGGDPWASPW